MGTKTKGTKTVWIDQFGEKEASYNKSNYYYDVCRE
jgi:hypothetical protein